MMQWIVKLKAKCKIDKIITDWTSIISALQRKIELNAAKSILFGEDEMGCFRSDESYFWIKMVENELITAAKKSSSFIESTI